MSNAKKIQTWRDDNPDEQITEPVLLGILGVDSLQNASLQYANLSGTDLSGVNLTGADLWYADLWDSDLSDANLTRASLMEADLTGAILWYANLQNTNMTGADLRSASLKNANLSKTCFDHANLSGATGGVVQINDLYAHPATLQPTPDGWYARVGCWYGTLDALHEIAKSDNDDDWPEACGDERERRRPLLQAILGVFDAHVNNHPDIIDQLNNQWGE